MGGAYGVHMPRRCLVVIAAAALAAAAVPASATVPGRAGRIAYVSEPTFAGAVLESVGPAGGSPRRLRSGLPHGTTGPSFAPDGRRVALTVPKPDARHVEILAGGRLRDVARGRSPAWSPDGRWIAFLSGQKVGSAIFLVRPDGTGLHAIGNRHLELGSSPPAWSPDGRTLVYARQTSRGTALWAIGADGRGAHALVTGHSATQPSFSPDGRRIAFIGFDGHGRMGIWVAGADGRGVRPLHVVPGRRTLFHYPVWSPDGRSIAFVLQGAWQRIALIRADGGGQRALSARTRFIAGVDWARAG
jgi:dipeptidyl aminopeptidase/acylaminoacyl peptidase